MTADPEYGGPHPDGSADSSATEAFKRLTATSLPQGVESLARRIGVDQRDVERRKAFLEFTDRDAALLATIHTRLAARSSAFTDQFYAHLSAFEETRALLPDDVTVERLKRSQAAYFDRLTSGNYANDYVQDRIRVGETHHRIGLGPKWYLGAYSRYLCELMSEVWDLTAADPGRAVEMARALVKVVFFDIGLTLDTYHQINRWTIEELQAHAQRIVSNIPSGVLVLSADLRVMFANQSFLDLVGRTSERVMGMPLEAFFPAHRWWDRVARLLGAGESRSQMNVDLVNADGTRHINMTLVPIVRREDAPESPDQERARLLLVLDDVTVHEQAEAELRESEERYRSLVENAHDMIQSVDPNGRFLFVNRAWLDTMGYREEDIASLTLFHLFHPDSVSHCRELFHRLVAGESPVLVETVFVAKDGRSVPVEGSATGRYVDGQLVATHSIFRNVTERKEWEARLAHVTRHDPLTNLPNRAVFLDRLEQALVRIRTGRSGRPLAVLILDLDRFKLVNETLGHAAGDRMLRGVAERLGGCLRDGDTVARIGGDEFAVLLPEVARAGDTVIVADKIFAALNAPFVVDSHELFVSVSIGISVAPDDGDESGQLLKNADAAMYRAKDQGRNTYQLYASAMNVSHLERLSLESNLRHALERDEFVVYYQPQVELRSGRVVGMEALVRWRHPEWGVVSPAKFIPVAEETGLIVPIGERVLSLACAQNRRWQEQGVAPFQISVNLSARQFQQSDLNLMVARVLGESGLDPRWLDLELTESLLLSDAERTVAALNAFHAMGVGLALDDFGTGYSSLSYLKRYPIDTIKIDQSFVRHITTDADDAAIATAIIAMAHSLKLTVVAEGVETEEQKAFLARQGCDTIQGYLLSRPLPADEMTAWLTEWAARGGQGPARLPNAA